MCVHIIVVFYINIPHSIVKLIALLARKILKNTVITLYKIHLDDSLEIFELVENNRDHLSKHLK